MTATGRSGSAISTWGPSPRRAMKSDGRAWSDRAGPDRKTRQKRPGWAACCSVRPSLPLSNTSTHLKRPFSRQDPERATWHDRREQTAGCGGVGETAAGRLCAASAPSAPRAATATEQSGRTGNADEAPAVAPRGRRGVGRTAGASQADRPVSSIVQRYVTQNDDAKRTVKLKRHAGQAASDTAMVRTDPRLTQCAGGEGEGLKGCATRTGEPAVALDPLALTPGVWLTCHFAQVCPPTGGCHFYFAQVAVLTGRIRNFSRADRRGT